MSASRWYLITSSILHASKNRIGKATKGSGGQSVSASRQHVIISSRFLAD